MKKTVRIILFLIIFLILTTIAFCVFFDQAIFTRNGTIYKINTQDKVIALTFDDGPSSIWTPQILNILKEHNVKATFFMIGKHVEKYPEIVKRIAQEGHEMGNHTYLHHVLIYYTDDELQLELSHTKSLIEKITGKSVELFRPPKAWLTTNEKEYIKNMGYKTILWNLNSKDWVTLFSEDYIIKHLTKKIRPGSIILFHDSGGIFSIEGGNRSNTIKSVLRLINELKSKGYKFLTVSELLKHHDKTP